MSSGGANRGQGAKNGVVRTMLIDSGMHTKIVDQLNDKLDNKELEAKDLLSLLSFFVPKLKAIELREDTAPSKPSQINFTRLDTKEMEVFSELTEKMLDI